MEVLQDPDSLIYLFFVVTLYAIGALVLGVFLRRRAGAWTLGLLGATIVSVVVASVLRAVWAPVQPQYTVELLIYAVLIVALSLEAVWLAFAPLRTPVLLLVFALGGLVIVFACLYSSLGILDADKKVTNDFWDCLYFSVVTLTTVGYGDFTPTPSARFPVAVEALSGYFYLALLIAVIIQRLHERRDQPL